MTEQRLNSKMQAFTERFDSISFKGVVLNVPYLIFLALLGVMYISNSNKGLSLAREIEVKKKALKEVRWRYKDAQANLIFATSEKQISERAVQLGILPLEKPAFEIKEVKKK